MMFRFIRDWEDHGVQFKKGEAILLKESEVNLAKERMKKYPHAPVDLVTYGMFVIPFTFLKEIKEKKE